VPHKLADKRAAQVRTAAASLLMVFPGMKVNRG
jgi:hypothetical protein